MTEIWKTIEPFPTFEISSEGRLRNKKFGRIINSGGYNRVMISYEGLRIPIYIDKLMDDYFGEPYEEWRVFPDARGYEISDRGRVRHRRTGRPVKINVKPNGEESVQFTDDGYRFRRPLYYVIERTFGRQF